MVFLMTGLGTGAGMIVPHKLGSVTAHVDSEVASGQDLSYLGSTSVSNQG
jgi:hypothetical protein